MYWDRGYAHGIFDAPPESQVVARMKRPEREYFQSDSEEPDETGVIAARQVLSRLLGYTVPADNGLYPGLIDYYHDLIIGPCSRKQTKRWDNHPWVHSIEFLITDWDCDYRLWLAELRPAIPDVPFTVLPSLPPASPKTGRPGRPAKPSNLTLPVGVQAEQRGTEWVLRSTDGYWLELLSDLWGDSEDVLRFPTEEAARLSYIQALRMYGERASRADAARKRLNLPELSLSARWTLQSSL